MFKSLKRIVYYVDDLEKAKLWYNEILDMKPIFDAPVAAIYNVGDCSLSLTKAKEPFTAPGTRMDVYWEVDDIDTVFEKLVGLGASILAPVTTVLNIRTAKLLDPFGNVIGLTGGMQNAEKRTVEKEASSTAMTVAFCRALAAKDSREKITGPDNMAEMFLNEEAKKLLADETTRKWAVQNLVTSALYGYFIARTAYFDSVYLKACKDHIPQIVFLGAGYDTRPYRFTDAIKNTAVFELDISPTQEKKIGILRENNVEIPDFVSFVPINFKTESISDVLQKAGYDKTKKTLFIWEGVTYYLEKNVVEDTLKFIHENSSVKSTLCFDYMTKKLESVNAAEPFRFWTESEEMTRMLSSHGFKISEHIEPSEMIKKYLTLRDGSQAESVVPFFNFITAVTVK